jgi:hypothetical protein
MYPGSKQTGETRVLLLKRDPTKKLKKAYQQKLESAMHAMRRGDVRENARLVAEAEKLKEAIDAAEPVAE